MPSMSQLVSLSKSIHRTKIRTVYSSQSRALCTLYCIKFAPVVKPFNLSIFRFTWNGRLFIESN